jgi:hypothetical protein
VRGDIQEHTAAEDGSNGVDGIAADAIGVRLHCRRIDAAVEFAAAREMAERIEVGADVAAQSQGIRSGTVAGRTDVVAVLLHKAEQKRRVRRMVRHACKVGLRQVEDAGGREQIEEGLHQKRYSRLNCIRREA